MSRLVATMLNGWRALARALHGVDDDAELERLTGGLDSVRRTLNHSAYAVLRAPDDRRCPCCGGKRCWAWRESGHTVGCGGHGEGTNCHHITDTGEEMMGCGGDAEPVPAGMSFRRMVNLSLLNPGRHTVRYALAHWVPSTWNPIPLRTRVMLWPSRWEARLGRPVQLVQRRLVLP